MLLARSAHSGRNACTTCGPRLAGGKLPPEQRQAARGHLRPQSGQPHAAKPQAAGREARVPDMEKAPAAVGTAGALRQLAGTKRRLPMGAAGALP